MVGDTSTLRLVLVHKPGKLQTKLDLLLRQKGHERGENDNRDIVLLKPEFLRAIHAASTEGTPGDHFLEEIKRHKAKWEVKVLEMGENMGNVENHGDYLTKDNLLYVPPEKSLWHEIVWFHHNTYFAGHPGQAKTTELILQYYWWPTIYRDVKAYARGCPTCQRTKTFPGKLRGLLSPNVVPS